MLKRAEMTEWAKKAHSREIEAQKVRVQAQMEEAAGGGKFYIIVHEPLLAETRKWLQDLQYTISGELETSFGVSWG